MSERVNLHFNTNNNNGRNNEDRAAPYRQTVWYQTDERFRHAVDYYHEMDLRELRRHFLYLYGRFFDIIYDGSEVTNLMRNVVNDLESLLGEYD